jgi:prepilin-type N-terminal cleavage/methylation domain-containing protein/prepilin-type processing-associated H-X9-DG protein
MKRRAFTLVELLVVISIIALLLALLMPALGKARKQAQNVVCRSNLKQWGFAYTMYAGDNNGYFFPGMMGPNSDSAEDWWFSKLWKYVKNEGIRFCPTASKFNPVQRAYPIGSTFEAWGPYEFRTYEMKTGQPAFSSYGQNAWIDNPTPGVNPYGMDSKNFWRKISVSGAREIPLMLDAAYSGAYPDNGQNPMINEAAFTYLLTSTINTFCINRHNGRVNCVFLDLSVDKIGLKQLWKLKWHKNYNRSSIPRKWPAWMATFE